MLYCFEFIYETDRGNDGKVSIIHTDKESAEEHFKNKVKHLNIVKMDLVFKFKIEKGTFIHYE